MRFYNPGQKIRLMRKRFNMNQAELEDTNMTRAFISMMESGKRNVSRTSSKILANKFNEVAEEREIKLNLDDEYFWRQPKEDARFYCENQLTLKNNYDELQKLLEIANEYQLDDIIATIYKENGDKYLDESQYIDAFLNYSNALGKYKELKDINSQIYVYNSMGICKSKRAEDEEAIFYYKKALDYARKENNYDYFIKTSYNLALSYSNMKMYEECIEMIDKNIIYSDFQIDKEASINANVLRANTLFKLNRKEEAVKKYFSIIDELEEKDSLLLSTLYNNIGEYYYEIGNLNESLKYISKAQKLKSKVNKRSLPHTLNTKGKVFFEQGFYDESIMIFDLAISIAEEYSEFTSLYNNYRDLVKVYEEKGELDKIKEAMNNFLSTLEENNIEEGKSFALYKLAEVSSKQGNGDETISLLRKLEPFLVNR